MTIKVKRNFENYTTRREAFLAYEELCNEHKTPIWIHGDESDIPYAIVIDFEDWIWLPVNESQQYKESECVEKYLGRKYA